MDENISKDAEDRITRMRREHGEMKELMKVIVDDNNYLPGHPTIVVALTHEQFVKIEEFALSAD